jgi:2-dehydro-3-deoxyphosphogluconate aldolase/(4S)-4-hydroxy-2-oxoglutarate aldolase
VGAGTVLNRESHELAVASGAAFTVSPGHDAEIVRAADEHGVPHIGGVITPTEVMASLNAGCRYLKVFPAGTLGGADLLRALSGPFAHAGIRLMPTGGVRESDLADYLSIPSVFAVGGTWIASRAAISTNDWEAITAAARRACTVVASLSRRAT